MSKTGLTAYACVPQIPSESLICQARDTTMKKGKFLFSETLRLRGYINNSNELFKVTLELGLK